MAKWQVSGEYFETCNCDYLCPCVISNFTQRPTYTHCEFAMLYHVDNGRFGDTALDGLSFVIVGSTPDVMGAGNWAVGLIIDERANVDTQARMLDAR